MPTFSYTARTANGELRNAAVDAPSRDDAVAMLRRQRLTVLKMDETRTVVRASRRRVTTRDVVVFTRQFATMINAGLPLVQVLDVLSNQSENPSLGAIAREVMFDVQSGKTVADALRRHPKVFSDLYVNLVAAGESGGMMDVMLNRLAVFLEKSDLLARKVRGAMVYPAVIMSVAGICVVILLWKVIPIFAGMFASSGAELPGPTQFVVGLSQLLIGYWWLILLVGAVLAVGGKQVYATPEGQLVIDRALLRLPVLGDLIRKSAVSRFTRTLGTLIGSGVSILEGLEITARTAGNRVMHDAILRSRTSIAGGDTIAAPLQRSGVFPPMVTSMIAVGEQTGGLDDMLAKVADFYDAEVDVSVSTLLSLLEPVMIVLLGVVVGGMLIAMYLPIFDMVNAVR